MFSIGAFAVIFDAQGRVLLCHRRDMDVWNLPGGGVESVAWMPTGRGTRPLSNRYLYEELGLVRLGDRRRMSRLHALT